MAGPDGIFLFDKPAGITSHDVVSRARRWFGTRAIGHAGTLDPLATGLLILCVNAATRMSEYLLGQDKAYAAEIKLGQSTNTDDAEGEVTATAPVPALGDEQLTQIARRFTGRISQVPPQFSAIKKDGQRAYALARKGESVELSAREVDIASLTLTRDADHADRLQAHVSCGSGTYIRALARDIGAALGCGAHLTALRRLRIGIFNIEDAIDNAAMQAHAQQGTVASVLQPMDRALSNMPALTLDDAGAQRMLMGQRIALPASEGRDAPLLRVYDASQRFIAVGEIAGGLLRPVKVFH
jgi:tRNA pseudouridine55 synthase